MPCFENEEIENVLVYIKFCKNPQQMIIRVLEPAAHLWVTKIMGLDSASVKETLALPKALVPLSFIEPKNLTDICDMKIYLVPKIDASQSIRTYGHSSQLQSFLDNVEAKVIIDQIRFVRQAHEPTEESLSIPLVWHRFKLHNPVGNPYQTFDLYSKLIAYLTSQSKREAQFCGFTFFAGLLHLREMKFEQKSDAGTPQIWFCIGLDPKITEPELSGLERNLKAYVMGLVMHTEVTDGLQAKPEVCFVCCGKFKEVTITNDTQLADIFLSEIGFNSLNKARPSIFLQNTAAANLWGLIEGLQMLLIIIDFTLTSSSDLAMLIFRLYETLSTSVLYRGVRIGPSNEPVIYSNYFSYFQLQPTGNYRFNLRLAFEHPILEEGMLKMLGIRVALEVFLRGYDAQKIEVDFGVVEKFQPGKLMMRKFQQHDTPVKARDFRYVTATEIPKAAPPEKRKGKGGQAETRKAMMQRLERERKKSTSKTQAIMVNAIVIEPSIEKTQINETESISSLAEKSEELPEMALNEEETNVSPDSTECVPLIATATAKKSEVGCSEVIKPLSLYNENAKEKNLEQETPNLWISTPMKSEMHSELHLAKPLPHCPGHNSMAERRRIACSVLLEFK